MKKDLNYYLQLPYTIRITKNDDGTYFAEVEELLGCITEGETETEALEMIEDAKQAWIAVALQRQITIPEPIKETFSGKFNVRMPKFLHRQLVYQAKRENVSLNTYITTSLASDLPTGKQVLNKTGML
jgi:antitoxin HicB